MPSKRPILVTGSHRSGSTWVGRIIAACPSVAYIDEPFHIKHDLGVCGARFDHWFTYVSEQNETDFYTHIKNTLDFRYNWTGKLKSIRTPKALHPLLVHYIRFLLYSHTNARPLLKDPISIFSVDWLASKFDMDVLVLIRHPAAFAGSLKVNNWTHPFSHFLDQFLLMRDHLYPFEEEIRKLAEEKHDIIDQAALLWKLIHHMIIKYQEKHDNWIFMRHEDISRDPSNCFRSIFSKLGLDCSQHVENMIEKCSYPAAHLPNRDSIQRASLSNILTWKSRLTEEEVRRVKTQVQDISRVFYSEEEW